MYEINCLLIKIKLHFKTVSEQTNEIFGKHIAASRTIALLLWLNSDVVRNFKTSYGGGTYLFFFLVHSPFFKKLFCIERIVESALAWMIAKVNTKLKVCKFCYSFNYPMKWTKRDFCRLISQGLEVPLSTFMLAYFWARFKYIYWNPAKFMFSNILVPFGRRSKGIECHPGSQIHGSLCQNLDSKL